MVLLSVLVLSESVLYRFRFKEQGRYSKQVTKTDALLQVTSTAKLHVPSRAFPVYPHSFPCIQEESTDKDTGIIFIKIHKSASSTISNLVKRWSKNKAIHPNMKQCKAHFQHAFAWSLPKLDKRIREKSFLFTFIREPTERFVSDFNYHGISKQKQYNEANLANFQNFTINMKKNEFYPGYGGYTFQYMTTQKEKVPPIANSKKYWNPSKPNIVQQPHALISHVDDLLQEYDFIGIASRMDESLVALTFLLKIPLDSVIYVRSRKTSGGYDFNAVKNECFFMQKTEATQDLKQYLASDQWKVSIAGDILLYKAVNLSLDKTIELIGREKFETRMNKYLELKNMVDDICGEAQCSRCSATGEVIDLTRMEKDKRCKVEWCIQAARIKLKQK
ncbi:hypothetical protein CTEN210_01082 [Chaetoceros tenuissimus]|uniref:Uncharacterized protein n=1 Tax=Chaetoceros tenuissimus TaxID=426638 RepID=A0AAD3CFC8_9STRA|nr:hypothetical protein CTEN210_01082 [Chaetoceros tenuissimus]